MLVGLGNFKEENRNILTQFVCFLIAFLSKLILQGLIIYGSKNDWSDYAFNLMEVTIHILIDIIPVTYMLYCHHKTYRRLADDKNNESETNDTSSLEQNNVDLR